MGQEYDVGEMTTPCSCCGASTWLTLLVAYMVVVQVLRFRRLRGMKELDSSAVYRQMAMLEFPFTVIKALEFALFRTYGVPSISKLLDKTREFGSQVGKRYDDTDLILREYSENLPESERTLTAMARMNAIHGMYSKEISNGDMLFTLSLFIVEPAKWIDRFEWRCCSEVEKAGLFGHFSLMGRRMGIKGAENWKNWYDANAFYEAYEAEHFRFAASNKAIADSTITLFLSIAPKLLRPAGRWAVYALMDPPLLKAMGLPQAPVVVQWLIKGSLLLRAFFLRFFMLPRPDFLASRRTPYDDASSANNGATARATVAAAIVAGGCSDLSRGGGFDGKTGDALINGDVDAVRIPRFFVFDDAKLGCLSSKDGYIIKNLGTSACPAGRLFEGVPTYTGKGGGGSDPTATNAVTSTAESKKLS